MIEAPLEVPAYRMLIPAGWEKVAADRAMMNALTAQARQVFKSQHRPDLDVEFSRMMSIASQKMKQGGVFALYLQTSVSAEEILPMSITASLVRGRLGGTLDRQVASLIREQGAGFLTDDRRIVRWVTDTVAPADLGGTPTRVIDYLISIPGRQRREAVQFTTTLPYPADDPAAKELVDQLQLLSDTVVSTFAWEATSG